jgi:transposase
MENHFIGLDIGKKAVDVAVPLGGSGFSCFRINNTDEGFRKLENELLKRKAELLKKKMQVQFWLVSEATGIYYIPIHAYFVEKGWHFTVVNPLSISKFREEQLKINKTDKEDCMLISKFGFQNAVRLGSTPAASLEIRKLTQLQVLRRCLQKNIQRLGGVTENLNFAKIDENYADALVESALAHTTQQLHDTEAKLIEVIKAAYPIEYKCLNSIKGVGKNLIIEVVTETNNLQKFKNMQGFMAYCGVVPSHHESGTSVYKKPKLAKTANRNLRQALFMSALSASKANKECRELYERLPPTLLPKQKLMHVGKLLSKQIWYCVRNKEVYKPESQRIKKNKDMLHIQAEKPRYDNRAIVEAFESEAFTNINS